MTDTALTDWIGRSRTSLDTISPDHLAKIKKGLDGPPPPLKENSPIPPGWHWAFFADITALSEIGRDGHQALGEFLPPVTLPRRMWASGDLNIARPLCVGETVRKTSTILSVEEKHGRTGELVFVRVGHEFAGDRSGEMREEHQIVYRDAPVPGATAPEPMQPPHEAESSCILTASPVQLFRYSAVTFNSHRIHYDVDFCRNEEGYDGLIVHGPLTATLLMDFACGHEPVSQIRRFTFRALSPLTHVHQFSLHVRKSGNGTFDVWACNHLGKLAMSAEAVMDQSSL